MPHDPTTPPPLERRFSLLQATALNMSNMVGMGPFMTIPLLMAELVGPQSLIGWAVALLITLPDGMIWAELGAALPGSGGSYVYLREAFGPRRWGRLMAFLFIWQFLLSGPLEIATGYIGFGRYLRYVWPGNTETQAQWWAAALGILNLVLLYRRIHTVALITVTLWIGTLLTTGAVIVTGALHFDPARAFAFPPDAFQFSTGFVLGLAAATRVGIYDYLGYYDICYIGDEVREPGRVIPRSILLSLCTVAVLYAAIHLSILGIIPWREMLPAVPGGKAPEISNFIVSVMMERVYGRTVSQWFTLLILWTTMGSLFALLLGYSRIPFAAARDGVFFAPFGKLHPHGFPALSLVVIGLIAIVCSFLPLEAVIGALLTTRILIQFVGQAVGLVLLRRYRPELERPYRLWAYPWPCVIAVIGWLYLFGTAGAQAIGFGMISLILGIGAYLLWAKQRAEWPFAPSAPSEAPASSQ